MNKLKEFCKKNCSGLLIILATALVLVVLALSLLYLYVRFSFSISEFSNLSLLPAATQEAGPSNQEDAPQTPQPKNGISQLYPTKPNGRTWSANWSDGNARTLISGQRDPFDDQFIARGNGTFAIDGQGLATMSGAAPRMYVYDQARESKWGDVEITVYARRISETGTRSSQGIVLGARSEHQDATLETPCNGATYYGRLLFDGRAVFQKEVIHEGAYSSNKPAESNTASWDTADGTMPKETWIGVKYIVKNNENDDSVQLELYRDLTDGKNGGDWEKVAQYVDAGDWSQINSDVDVEEKCGYGANRVLTEPGTSVFVRNDLVEKMQYKLFSVREIE